MRLESVDLVCRRGDREVFHGLTFAVTAGEALIVTGPNGAGKSSLLRMIAGLIRVAGGRLDLTGGDPELTLPEQVHYLGHHDALKPALSVAENLTFWTRYLDGKPEAMPDALDTVGLARLRDLPAAYLSAGQRRRLSVARLLTVPRPIWLLDEPTAALDVGAQARLAELMQAHLAGGGMILAATHGPLGLPTVRELNLGANSSSGSNPSSGSEP